MAYCFWIPCNKASFEIAIFVIRLSLARANNLNKIEMENIKEEFRKMIESGRIPLFEIEVIRNGEQDWILFDISISDDKIIAHHEPLTEAEEKSDKIAFKSVDIDPDFSLDWHLQGLMEECQNALMESEFVEVV